MIKKNVASVILLIVKLSFSVCVQGQTPKDPVFTIILEQKGSASGESMQKYVEAKYWPCSIWNSGYFGTRTFGDKSIMGAQTTATPEGLLAIRGSIAGMKPAEVLLFYVREKSGKGNEGNCSATLSTIGKGIFSWTIVTKNETKTYTNEKEVADLKNHAFGPAANTEAIIKRTPEGAVLTFSEPILEAEGYCDFFGLFNGNNVPEDLSKVLTFTLSNEDLNNWSSLQKINERTLPGAEEGSLHIRATFRGGSASSSKPEVMLDGCSELGVGEQGQVNASGKPEGGSYRFWVEPQGMLTVESKGTSAILHGSSPGSGTLYVEYTSPEGKTNQTSQPAYCVKIENYNGGQEIPQIPLFDIYGNKLSGVLKLPVSAQPSNIEELVDYVAADQSVISVVGLSGEVELRGSRKGKTTFQAKTNCKNTIGPTVEVEVVNCDKETVEALERMREAGMENLKEANERLQKISNSEEFEKARDEIVESTIELLAKSALTIIGSGKIHGPVETAVEIAEAGEAVSEMVASATKEEFDERTLTATLKALGTGATKALLGAMGVHEAAKKFGGNLGQIILHESEMKDEMENFENADKALQKIIRQQQICKGEKTEPQKKDVPKTEPTPEPTEPTTKTETPPVKKPAATTEIPTDKESTIEEPPISPPSPTSEPRQVGLPYSPASECGCISSKGIGVSAEGFSALQTGMENLGKCVDNFSNGPVNGYIQTLNEWTYISDSLAAAVKSGSVGFKVAAGKAVLRIKELIGQTKSYDQAGKTFSEEFKACPESMKIGIGVINSAKTVTIDSINTKY